MTCNDLFRSPHSDLAGYVEVVEGTGKGTSETTKYRVTEAATAVADTLPADGGFDIARRKAEAVKPGQPGNASDRLLTAMEQLAQSLGRQWLSCKDIKAYLKEEFQDEDKSKSKPLYACVANELVEKSRNGIMYRLTDKGCERVRAYRKIDGASCVIPGPAVSSAVPQ